MEKKEVVVVVPLYKPELNSAERASLRQTVEILGRYPIVLLTPQGLDLSSVMQEFPGLAVREVSDQWLGRTNGIAGYNRMMLSAGFYDLFSDYEYLLICHTDAWIFRDELSSWCAKGYDCVAAPWVRRKVYNLPILKHYLRWRLMRSTRSGQLIRQSLYGKVGNGGLSLRRVERFRAACTAYTAEIERFCAAGNHLGNEDVFWAVVPGCFRYPSQEEALQFAFDTNPSYCYALCDKRLPMGCHSWSKPRMLRFWRGIIPFDAAVCDVAEGK